VGKYVLVGLTYLDGKGGVRARRQLHGDIVSADRSRGVVIRLRSDGSEFPLPPDMRAYAKAAPGEFRLKSTGEVVVNPDYTAQWTIEPPDS
jgi:hypothetical protein